MKCLVTGGAGYLGGGVVDLAVEAGHDVRVYDRLLYEHAYLRGDVDFVYGDVRDTAQLRPHLEWADAVIWLAGIVGDGACALDPLTATEVNHDAVEWMAGHFDGRIVYTSTCSVYGAQDGLLTEASPTGPLSLYAATKLAAEGRLDGKNALAFRLGTLYGHGGRVRLDLVVNTLTAKAATERRLKVFGGAQYRPLLHVHDAARGIVDGLASTACGVVNLVGENQRILDVAEKIRATVPGTVIEIVETTFEDARNYQADGSRATALLGFTPQLRVEDGIRQIYDLVTSGRVRDPGHPRWTNHGILSGGNHAA